MDVIVVGGGIVGLSCALALGNAGFQCALIESQTCVNKIPERDALFDPKVVAITRASELFFKQLGVWDLIEQSQRCCPYSRMQVWDSESDGLIEFRADEFFEANLGHIIEQQVIIAALWQKLQQQVAVTIFSQASIQEMHLRAEEVTVRLHSGQSLSARLIIGADGANSQIRKLSNIESVPTAYQQSALVAIITHEKPHQFTAYQQFNPGGPLALLPLANIDQSALVWTLPTLRAREMLEQDNHDFSAQLAQTCQYFLGKMQVLSNRALFNLQSHHSTQYVKTRCALIGDAAHTLHPLAGQGVNLGLLDVIALVNVLTPVRQKNKDYGELSILQRYERQRRLHNHAMIKAMEGFNALFGSRSNLLRRLRNSGLHWVNQNRVLKRWFVNIALGKGMRLRDVKENQAV